MVLKVMICISCSSSSTSFTQVLFHTTEAIVWSRTMKDFDSDTTPVEPISLPCCISYRNHWFDLCRSNDCFLYEMQHWAEIGRRSYTVFQQSSETKKVILPLEFSNSALKLTFVGYFLNASTDSQKLVIYLHGHSYLICY